ncbi:MAG: AAA family ATPase [Bacteroidaceae bacterium]|nr:AAA family ATPase [Bacteroidaceae bacterium]
MTLTPQQQHVLEQIKVFMNSDASVFILKGYAGTGKTTLLKFVKEYLSTCNPATFMAPTGRAARVLAQKLECDANTIHRSIYSKAVIKTKKKEKTNHEDFKFYFPIYIPDHKVVAVVDEASMVTSKTHPQELHQFGTDNLMDDLLTHVRLQFGGKIIFVGDPAQLPPVGESTSQALNADFFRLKGLKVMEAELTEVLRQKGDSLILKNAMQIRDLLQRDMRTRLVFEEQKSEVESLPAEDFLTTYFANRKSNDIEESVVICFSNSAATAYNIEIRQHLFQCYTSHLIEGDVLMCVQNNYTLNVMNGDFVHVVELGAIETLSAPIYVDIAGKKERKVVQMNFQTATVRLPNGILWPTLLFIDLLDSPHASLNLHMQKALYVNFCMRHPNLTPNTESFASALLEDPYYSSLKVKFGYAVTGHKCQGGEWNKAFVDYSGRTGISNDCLRWAYTATTRARDVLYVTNLPHITPFSKFRIDALQKCKSMPEECKILKKAMKSPFHNNEAADFLHAKYFSIAQNLEYTPYMVAAVESRPYIEMYTINTPDGFERYDLHYKAGGVFNQAKPQQPSAHSVMICTLLNSERAMLEDYKYTPSSDSHAQLHRFIKAACDTVGVTISNVVEHLKEYCVHYYFYTSNTFAYLKVYIDAKGFVSYAKPMSLLGNEDTDFVKLIEEIERGFH